jgi:hypothetical protein
MPVFKPARSAPPDSIDFLLDFFYSLDTEGKPYLPSYRKMPVATEVLQKLNLKNI